ncbi:sugar MFS transporter [Mucilaginibacter rigui]|uniref:Sugar MFS transporter n=1 Tax=Mucilaginibacter rigui TaxID=534635 RepID=A0ABR7X7M1_9SPHI|nr:sugar MFS transporter [Mucilaginibacter rigui]MBD1386574.1 sugar MFS transporter [Mucilaginibacter rigui]
MANIPFQGKIIDSYPGSKQNYVPALVSLGVLYFMMGAITCLNDTLVPYFKAGFSLSYSQSSLVQFYFFLTYGLVSIPAGKIVDRIGYKMGMVTGFSIAAIGAMLFYPASVFHQYSLFLGALFIIAIGIVLLQVAANPYVTILGPAKTASSRLTLIQGVGSLGTTVAPIFGAYFILSQLQHKNVGSEAVKYPYLGIAVLLILIAVIVSRLNLPVIGSSASSPRQKEVGSVFSFRNLNFGILGIFFYVGAEVSVGTFLTNYVAETLSVEVHDANSYVAFYWGSMLVGRLLGAIVLKVLKPQLVLVICSIAAVSLIIISVNTTGLLAVWAMIAVGLFNSVMFAIIFSLSVDGLGSHTAKGSGLLSTAIAGGAIVSYAMGIIKDNFDWKITFIIPIICYLYIVFYGVNGYKSKVKVS